MPPCKIGLFCSRITHATHDVETKVTVGLESDDRLVLHGDAGQARRCDKRPLVPAWLQPQPQDPSCQSSTQGWRWRGAQGAPSRPSPPDHSVSRSVVRRGLVCTAQVRGFGFGFGGDGTGAPHDALFRRVQATMAYVPTARQWRRNSFSQSWEIHPSFRAARLYAFFARTLRRPAGLVPPSSSFHLPADFLFTSFLDSEPTRVSLTRFALWSTSSRT